MQQFFQFIILTFVYSSTCFGRFPAHHQELNDCSGSLWFYLRIVVTVVLCSWSARQNRSWPSVSVESVDSECWSLNNANFYASIMRLTVEERVFILESYLKTMSCAHRRKSLFEKFIGAIRET